MAHAERISAEEIKANWSEEDKEKVVKAEMEKIRAERKVLQMEKALRVATDIEAAREDLALAQLDLKEATQGVKVAEAEADVAAERRVRTNRVAAAVAATTSTSAASTGGSGAGSMPTNGTFNAAVSDAVFRFQCA